MAGKLKYQLEWEGDDWAGQYIWEPACNVPTTTQPSIIQYWKSRKGKAGCDGSVRPK